MAGMIRSKRAAELFANGNETSYFGINKYIMYYEGMMEMPEYGKIALEKKICQSDIVFVMEQWMKDVLERLTGFSTDKIVVLGIEDRYMYGSTELDDVLKEKITPCLEHRGR
jgi:predicted protein tyrosine phosphatase